MATTVKPKKPKRLTKKKIRARVKTAKRKGLAHWSRKVRTRDGGCLVCNSVKMLNAHHILPRQGYPEFMFDANNGASLCPKHHKFGKYSAHKNPVWFAEFLRKFHLRKYRWAAARIGDYR